MQRLLRLPEGEERCAAGISCPDRHQCLRWRAYPAIGTPLADYSFDRSQSDKDCVKFLELPSDKEAP